MNILPKMSATLRNGWNGPTNGTTKGATKGAAPSNDPLPQELVNAMQALFGKHPGYRTSRCISHLL